MTTYFARLLSSVVINESQLILLLVFWFAGWRTFVMVDCTLHNWTMWLSVEAGLVVQLTYCRCTTSHESIRPPHCQQSVCSCLLIDLLDSVVCHLSLRLSRYMTLPPRPDRYYFLDMIDWSVVTAGLDCARLWTRLILSDRCWILVIDFSSLVALAWPRLFASYWSSLLSWMLMFGVSMLC